MAVLKCKMCGGNLNVTENDTVCTCEYCGTIQTIPLVDTDKKVRLFNRANEYRMNNDFSRAYNAYEAIVSENPQEAEAYWGMVLSEYGVEYVDDPRTGRKIPTCHRTSLKPVRTNRNYLKALECTDIEGKMIYEDEAEELDKLQKAILNVSSREKPYDVFISYKESDDDGNRTIDSVIAQDLYDELTNKGLRVFFSRISLEDKFGQNYEPFIYSALNTAKVMLLVVTRNEHCNAAWVKNEWSRYLDFIRNDSSRSLIPVIKDMSPYELPDELQRLQVLDLNKIGSRQDLIRGVLKITGHLEKKKAEAAGEQNIVHERVNIGSLLKRAKIFMEDGDFEAAEDYYDRVLDNDPENGEAYLGKLLLEKDFHNLDELVSYYRNLYSEDVKESRKAVEEDEEHIMDCISRYSIRNYLVGGQIRPYYSFDATYLSSLPNRIKQKKQIENELRNDRLVSRVMKTGSDTIKHRFNEILSAYDDRINQAKEEDEEAIKTIRQNYETFLNEADVRVKSRYDQEYQKREDDYLSFVKDAGNLSSILQARNLIENFTSLGDFKDSKEYVRKCQNWVDGAEQEAKHRLELQEKKREKVIFLSVLAVIVLALGLLLGPNIYANIQTNSKYNKAKSLYEKGDYDSAYVMFDELGDYKDSASLKLDAGYNEAVAYYENGDYTSSYTMFKKLGDYKDSAVYLNSIVSDHFSDTLKAAEAGDTVKFGSYEQDNDLGNGKEVIEWRVLAREDKRILLISEYGLDCQPFNSSQRSTDWETCSLRKWLNSEFYEEAFSGSDKEIIVTSKVVADVNPNFPTDKGKDTEDNVFILSLKEAELFFDSNEDRICDATEFSFMNGTIKGGNGSCWWWLRTAGAKLTYASYVSAAGYVDSYGFASDTLYGSIRPVIWIQSPSEN